MAYIQDKRRVKGARERYRNGKKKRERKNERGDNCREMRDFVCQQKLAHKTATTSSLTILDQREGTMGCLLTLVPKVFGTKVNFDWFVH